VQFTDGIVGVRNGTEIEILAVLESKAGPKAAAKLEDESVRVGRAGSRKVSLAELSDNDRELRQTAIEDFRRANRSNERIADMSADEIDRKFRKQVCDRIWSDAEADRLKAGGQPERDMERALGGGQIYETLPDGSRQRINLHGSGGGRAGRGSFQNIGFTPKDITVDEAGIRQSGTRTDKAKSDFLAFQHQPLDIDAQKVDALSEEFASRALDM
jgi:hypothetical protein